MLKDIILSYRPAILFLSETLVYGSRMEEIHILLSFDYCFSVDRLGRSGGLSILWMCNVKLSISGYSQNFIDIVIKDQTNKWRFTGYYGLPERHRRRAAWNLLRALALKSDLPWLYMGDYNDLASDDEKVGGCSHSNFLFNGFRDCLNDYGLCDLPSVGSKFTWVCLKNRLVWFKEKLDRAMANREWSDIFPNALLSVRTSPKSDHKPLLINMVAQNDRRPFRTFRFDNA